MTGPLIETRNLTKVFEEKERKGLKDLFRGKKKQVVAVDNVSLQIGSSEIFGLLGPNGAGKTTTVKLLCTLLEPTSGDAYVNGHHVVKDSEKVRESIGVMLTGERTLYWKLTGRENLQYFSALYHVPPRVASERIETTLAAVELSDRADTLVEEYSTGMRVRLSFAKSLLNDAPVLFLDEPTLSLDPQSARKVREIISDEKGRGKTILLTTHYMEEAEQLCDRVAIIDRGKVIASGSPLELKRKVARERAIEVEASNLGQEVAQKLKGIPGVGNVVWSVMDPAIGSGVLRVLVDGSAEVLPAVLQMLLAASVRIGYVKPSEPTLEDVFIELTGRGIRD